MRGLCRRSGRGSCTRGGSHRRRLGRLTEPTVEIQLLPLEVERHLGHGPNCTRPLPLSRASSTPITRLLRVTACLSSSARAKPASFTCICGRGRASPLSLAASTASDISSSCRFSSSRALRVPPAYRPGRLVRRPLCPCRLRGEAAPLTQCQPVGLEGESIQPLGRLAQAPRQCDIFQLAAAGIGR